MVRHRQCQRGAADLVSVGVGLAMLAIVFAGTAASFVYGREALTREEHFKAVAYLLRAKMEEVQSAMQLVTAARESGPQSLMGEYDYPPVYLDESMRLREKLIVVYIHRRPVDAVDLAETGMGTIDYYVLTMDANWHERDYAEDGRGGPGKQERLSFTTAFVLGRAS